MGRGDWEAGWGGDGERPARLPRTEDLPVAEHGYDLAAVERAFDAFYRHAAELDASLRALEAIETFQRQAAELRADLRALRTAAWGPIPTRAAWTADAARERTRGGVPEVVPRLAVEAAFIIVVAVGAALADVNTVLIVLLVLAAWLIVGLGELVISTARPSYRRAPAPVAPVQPAPAVVACEPVLRAGDETEEAPVLVPAEDLPEPEPAAEAAAEPVAEAEPEPEPARELEEEAALELPAAPEPKPRRRWLRRRGEAEVEPEPEAPPRHVRVLPAAAADAVDPWEQGPELPIPDAAEAEVEAVDEPEGDLELEVPAHERVPVAEAAEPEPSAEEEPELERDAEPREPPPALLVQAERRAVRSRVRLRRGRR